MLRIKKLGSNCNRSSIQCFFIQSSSWNGTMDKLPRKLSFLLLTLKASESSKNSMQYENTKCFSKVFFVFSISPGFLHYFAIGSVKVNF